MVASVSAPAPSEAIDRHADTLRRDGFVMLKDVLSLERVAQLNAVCDRLISARPGEEAYNFPEVAEYEPLVADMIEEPLALGVVVNVLGYNLGLNNSLINIRPPVAPDNVPKPGEIRKMGVGRMVNLGWHRDGPSPQFPRIQTFSCKVCYVLSDMSRPGRGNTKVIPGSHLRADLQPDGDPERNPPGAIEVLGAPGDAFIFDMNTWHGAATNTSDVERRLLFISYSYLWTAAQDAINPTEAVMRGASPLRRQLFGALYSRPVDRWIPTEDMLPLKAFWRGGELTRNYA